MATSQQFLVSDNSTLANFKSWASAISAFFTTAGWTQSADTGQVNWSTIATVPGSGAFVYEVWQPNDGLTTFYLKVEYGNYGNANSPTLRVSLGTGTNGAGTLTGFVTPATPVQATALTGLSSTATYECNLSGVAGRMGVMMWRTGANNQQQFFAVQRSLDATGAPTGSYVTLWTHGDSTGRTLQQSVSFALGVAPPLCSQVNGTANSVTGCTQTAFVRGISSGGSGTVFNSSIPMDLCAPLLGQWQDECTVCGTADPTAIVDGLTFGATVYGATKIYMPTRLGSFAYFGAQSNTGLLCMEYD